MSDIYSAPRTQKREERKINTTLKAAPLYMSLHPLSNFIALPQPGEAGTKKPNPKAISTESASLPEGFCHLCKNFMG
jgi:hypothetical protein